MMYLRAEDIVEASVEGVVLGTAGLAVGRLGLAAVHARVRTLELRLVSDGQMQSIIEDAESKSTIFACLVKRMISHAFI